MKHFCRNLWLLPLFAILSAVALWSCKVSDSVTGEDSGTSAVTEITTKTIDAKGGILTLGILQVDIPQNAISTSTQITLSKVTDRPFDTDQKSDLMYIKNLPDVLGQPITISLSGFTQNDKLTTFLAEKTYVNSLKREVVSYSYIANSYVNGKVQIILPVISSNKSLELKAGELNPVDLGIVAVTGHNTMMSKNGNFRVTYPALLEADAVTIPENMEASLLKFRNAPFEMSLAKRTKWPVDVVVAKLEPTTFGLCVPSYWGDNYIHIVMNTSIVKNQAISKITAAHELMHLLQSFYDSRNSYSKVKFAPPSYWIDEAVSAWVEGYFAASPDYVSSVRQGMELYPDSAIIRDVHPNAQNYGYGMSSMIKYITGLQGISIVRTIYEQLLAGKLPAEAIRIATGKSYYEWWGYFVDQNNLGKIYKDVTTKKLEDYKSGRFYVATANDSVKQFDFQYGQLESRIFVDTIAVGALSDGASLQCLIKNPDTELITVYKYNATTIEKLGQDLKSVTIPDIKTIVKAGYKIMTVVTNHKYDYSSSAGRNISLITRIKQQVIYKSCTFDFRIPLDGYSKGLDFGFVRTKIPCQQIGNKITMNWTINEEIANAEILLNSNNTINVTISSKITYSTSSRSFNISIASLPIYYDYSAFTDYSAPYSKYDIRTFITSVNYTDAIQQLNGSIAQYIYNSVSKTPNYFNDGLTVELYKN